MNILIVSHFDPAGAGIKLKKSIEKHTQHTCRMLNISAHPFGYDYDILIDELEDFKRVVRLVDEADVIQFLVTDWENTLPFGPINWGECLLGKRVSVMHLGEPFLLNPQRQVKKYLKAPVKVIPAWNRVADELPEGSFQPLPTPMYDFMDDPSYADIFLESRDTDDMLIVSHLPSADVRKATFLFEAVMDRIISEFKNVEFQIIRGMPHRDALRAMWKSDIILDEIWIEGTWGQPAIEAASMGKVALAYLSEDTINWWKSICGCDYMPVVCVDTESLETQLKKLITDKPLRQDLGRRGRTWFKRYWDSPAAVNKIIDFYKSLPFFTHW